MSSNLTLKLRLRKLGSAKFVTHIIDEDQYTLNELQTMINYGREHRSAVSLAVRPSGKGPKTSIIKIVPTECDNIAVLFDYD